MMSNDECKKNLFALLMALVPKRRDRAPVLIAKILIGLSLAGLALELHRLEIDPFKQKPAESPLCDGLP